jgi:hypothetical protein
MADSHCDIGSNDLDGDGRSELGEPAILRTCPVQAVRPDAAHPWHGGSGIGITRRIADHNRVSQEMRHRADLSGDESIGSTITLA